VDPDIARRRAALAARLKAVQAELAPIVAAERERKIRAGKVKPRNAREWEIFAADLLRKPVC